MAVVAVRYKPYILPPEQLFKILKEHEHVDNFPVPLKETYYMALVDICEINIGLNGKRALLEIRIPLLEEQTFNLVTVIFLPVHGWIFHSIINTQQRLVLLDPMRLVFIPIATNDLINAKKLNDQMILKRYTPDYSTSFRDNCLTSILTKHEPENCETRYMQIQNTVWIQLHTGNQWLGIAPKTETLHILCSDKTPRHLEINHNFILTLAPDCTGISLSATLKPNNILYNNKTNNDQIVLVRIRTPNINISETDIRLNLVQEVHIDPEKLQSIGRTLGELQEASDQIFHHQRMKTCKEKFFEYLSYAGYAALAGLLFVFFVKIGFFRALVNALRTLIGNCYTHCSFNSRAPTHHVRYSSVPRATESRPLNPTHMDRLSRS